ncbi:MAG TPA: hypothetical protein VH796_00995 [Nitrososphaeraceae archaeon]|jgi:hypothetical protein
MDSCVYELLFKVQCDKTEDFSNNMSIDTKANTEAGEEENQPPPWSKKKTG